MCIRDSVVASIAGDPALLPVLADLIRRHEPRQIRVLTPLRDLFAWIQDALDELPVRAQISAVTAPWEILGEN